jgi:hypothetical protein
MMKSWKSTLGGALSALGTALMGVGIIPQLSSEPNRTLTSIALAGFICSALGQFFGHLFAADTTQVQKALDVQNDRIEANAATIAEAKSDTTQLARHVTTIEQKL